MSNTVKLIISFFFALFCVTIYGLHSDAKQRKDEEQKMFAEQVRKTEQEKNIKRKEELKIEYEKLLVLQEAQAKFCKLSTDTSSIYLNEYHPLCLELCKLSINEHLHGCYKPAPDLSLDLCKDCSGPIWHRMVQDGCVNEVKTFRKNNCK